MTLILLYVTAELLSLYMVHVYYIIIVLIFALFKIAVANHPQGCQLCTVILRNIKKNCVRLLTVKLQ